MYPSTTQSELGAQRNRGVADQGVVVQLNQIRISSRSMHIPGSLCEGQSGSKTSKMFPFGPTPNASRTLRVVVIATAVTEICGPSKPAIRILDSSGSHLPICTPPQ